MLCGGDDGLSLPWRSRSQKEKAGIRTQGEDEDDRGKEGVFDFKLLRAHSEVRVETARARGQEGKP